MSFPTILLIINNKTGGGAEKIFDTLRKELKVDGYSVKIVYTSANRINNRLIRFIYNYLKVFAISIRFNPFIISGLHEENFLAYLAPTRKQKILSLHSNEFPKSFLGSIHNKLYGAASHLKKITLVCVSRGLRSEYMRRIKGFDSSVIYNGILDFPIAPVAPSNNNSTTLNIRKLKNILVVGRFVHQKNISLAIDIFEEWQKISADIKMTIVGEGPQLNEITSSIESKNLTKKILIKPWSKNINQEYAQNDILLFTSKIEGFGNVIVEAISHGLYVFANDCNYGPREILFPDLDLEESIQGGFLSNSFGTLVGYSKDDPIEKTVLDFSKAYESFLASEFIVSQNGEINQFLDRFSKDKLKRNYLQLLGL
ncbi:glycosyltransferase [Paracoccaceae bacterium]|nr:glycosyltransferase [Paracoccaceae bacterium]